MRTRRRGRKQLQLIRSRVPADRGARRPRRSGLRPVINHVRTRRIQIRAVPDPVIRWWGTIHRIIDDSTGEVVAIGSNPHPKAYFEALSALEAARRRVIGLLVSLMLVACAIVLQSCGPWRSSG